MNGKFGKTIKTSELNIHLYQNFRKSHGNEEYEENSNNIDY